MSVFIRSSSDALQSPHKQLFSFISLISVPKWNIVRSAPKQETRCWCVFFVDCADLIVFSLGSTVLGLWARPWLFRRWLVLCPNITECFRNVNEWPVNIHVVYNRFCWFSCVCYWQYLVVNHQPESSCISPWQTLCGWLGVKHQESMFHDVYETSFTFISVSAWRNIKSCFAYYARNIFQFYHVIAWKSFSIISVFLLNFVRL